MIKLLFNTLSILKKKHGMALEMIKAAINHVLDDVCTQTGCIKCANVCTKKCSLFETFSCFVLDFLLNLQPKRKPGDIHHVTRISRQVLNRSAKNEIDSDDETKKITYSVCLTCIGCFL